MSLTQITASVPGRSQRDIKESIKTLMINVSALFRQLAFYTSVAKLPLPVKPAG